MATVTGSVQGTVPLQPVASQTVTITLGNQNCTINVYAKQLAALQFLLETDTGLLLATEKYAELDVTPDTFPVSSAVFVDLYVNGTLIIGGVPAFNETLIVRDAYLGFTGDLVFYDTQGSTDPVYTGLGSRYVLAYIS